MKIRDRIKSLRRVKASELAPNPRNWRKHPQAQADAMRGILAEVGYAGAVLARETPDGLQLIDGHLRAELDPDGKIPVLVLDVTEAEANKILATFDPIGAAAEADPEKLAALLAEIDVESEALDAMLGELAAENGVEFEPEDPVDSEPQIDRAAELQKEWKTEAGQLWIIKGKAGEHRVLCGDSTKREEIHRLMGSDCADMVFTDPPYNCADGMSKEFYAGCNSPAMKELSDTEWDKGFDINEVLVALSEYKPINGTVYICTSHMLAPIVWEWMRAENAKHSNYVCWCKPNPMPSLAKRHPTWATELICYATFGKHTFNFPTNGHALNWWELASTAKADGHPTQKPVAVPSRAIEYSSQEGDCILDPFLGSGTTLIAAESLNRRCFGIEISPAYVAVILQRAKDCGMTPRLEK